MRTLAVALMALLAAGVANAQVGGSAMTAEIPFVFEMSGTSLPAGEYNVTFSNGGSYIVVKEVDSKSAALAIAISLYPKDMSAENVKLVFNRYNDRYFLSQIWHPALVRELPKSKQERELVTSRVIAANPIRVVIAARVVR